MSAPLPPIEYVEHEAWFCGRCFYVDENVLIPRPETAQLVDLVKDIAGSDPAILDVGTGSGCIAITLALELPDAKTTASDVSEPALNIARHNAKTWNAKINFTKSDLLAGSDPAQYDIIAANLPYVDKTWGWVDEAALSPEPSLALYADDGGLELIKKLTAQAPRHLTPHGHLVLEADPVQHAAIITHAARHGFELANQTEYALLLKITS